MATTVPDGRIYVAQVSGSQVSAIDVNTGAVEAISAMGGDIVAPDDLVFDPQGNMYVTEITEGRVNVRSPNGVPRGVHGDRPVANPLTSPKGRPHGRATGREWGVPTGESSGGAVKLKKKK